MEQVFNPSEKMSDLLVRFPALLVVFSRMGLSFGYGDASVSEVCSAAGVSSETFLLICRVYGQDNYVPSPEELGRIDREQILNYLKSSHRYYVDYALRDMASGISRMILPCADENQRVFWKFFADFKEEISEHLNYEENVVFADSWTEGAIAHNECHSRVEGTLDDLRNIVMSHLPEEADQAEAFNVLALINSLAVDIHKHIILEETAMEGRKIQTAIDNMLTDREREVLVCVARGMINKQIAEKLNISVHTVISHRKNITQKTGIKTIAGLTVYAVLNNLLTV